MHYWFSGGHMIWMAISWLVGIGLFLMLVWLLIVAVNGRTERSHSPEEILSRRYPSGEIYTEEYERVCQLNGISRRVGAKDVATGKRQAAAVTVRQTSKDRDRRNR